MRVYLPLTVPLLRTALGSGAIGPAPLTGYAVTPTLREWYADGDTDELEYAATLAAARGSLRLLQDDDDAPRRRVVVAADVANASIRPVPDVERAAVLITDVVRLALVSAALVDDPDAAEIVASAAKVVRRADVGDEDAEFAVGEAAALELQWYATQELKRLVDG
jgi:hypothetical protein